MKRMNQTDAGALALVDAYRHASGDGRYSVPQRQLFYAVRPEIERLSGFELKYHNFTTSVLPTFMERHPDAVADWDVLIDDRSVFIEPHSGREIPLGTLAVREYLGEYVALPEFGGLLYVEKEGFAEIFRQAQFAQRYDIGIVYGKGQSAAAVRRLCDELWDRHRLPLFVLHDFDAKGFEIAHWLRESNVTYTYTSEDHEVHDLGLRLEHIALVDPRNIEEIEHAAKNKAVDPRPRLIRHGATPDEVAQLCTGMRDGKYVGRRVELNALTTDQLVQLIEDGLEAHGVEKVVPDENRLASEWRDAVDGFLYGTQLAAETEEIKRRVRARTNEIMANVDTPDGLLTTVKDNLEDIRTRRWSDVLESLAWVAANDLAHDHCTANDDDEDH